MKKFIQLLIASIFALTALTSASYAKAKSQAKSHAKKHHAQKSVSKKSANKKQAVKKKEKKVVEEKKPVEQKEASPKDTENLSIEKSRNLDVQLAPRK